jgi:hypothetical protein
MSFAGDLTTQFSTFKYRIKCRTTSKNIFTIKDPSGESSIEASFYVTLECMVTKTLKGSGH